MRSQLSTTSRLVKGGGFAVGALIVLLVLLGFRVPRGDGHAGSDVILLSQPTGELAVTPTGAFISTTNLEPGRSQSGRFAVTNQTGKALRVSLHALPDQPELDRMLRVRVAAGPLLLYHGPLHGLRAWTRSASPAAGRWQQDALVPHLATRHDRAGLRRTGRDDPGRVAREAGEGACVSAS